jgi:hypothetical protein
MSDILEYIIDKIGPLWFRKWFFEHKWNNPPTEYDKKYLLWVLGKQSRFYRRFRLLSDEDRKQLIEMLTARF